MNASIKILFISVFTAFYPVKAFFYNKPFTIMINPAGEAKTAGRMLNDSFERGITLQFAQELKNRLETNRNIKVIMTRAPGETLEPLQSANFSNRLNSNLYLSVHFYKESEPISQLFLYNYVSDPVYVQSSLRLYFYNFDDAYLINISKTLKYGNKIKHAFQDVNYKNAFNFKGFFSIPFKPLVGVISPALAIEIGLKDSKDWVNFVDPIVKALEGLYNYE